MVHSAGIHHNVNKKAERSQTRRKRVRVEKRKIAGTRAKHAAAVAAVKGPARTGKAARKQLKRDRRANKETLLLGGLLDAEMTTAPQLTLPATTAAPAADAMQL